MAAQELVSDDKEHSDSVSQVEESVSKGFNNVENLGLTWTKENSLFPSSIPECLEAKKIKLSDENDCIF